MKLPAAVLILGLTLSASAQAGMRVALVRVADVYKSMGQSQRQQDRVTGEFKALRENQRVTDLQKLVDSLKLQRASLPPLTDPTDGAMSKLREYAVKYREAQTLQEDYESYRKDETIRINTVKVSEMHASLDLIVETARKIGKEQGFDWVLDVSGQSNSTVPVVLYAKTPTDISAQVLAALDPNAKLKSSDDGAAPQSTPPAPPAIDNGEIEDLKH